jgi:predicted TPR repeat methyltransferase
MALPPLHLTTGDPRADTRFAYAQGYWEDGDTEAAQDMARQTLEIAPHFAPAFTLLGKALLKLNHQQEAIEAFLQALQQDKHDLSGAKLELIKLKILPHDDAMSEAYIRSLFEAYAPRFDAHLNQDLHYRAPLLIHAMLERTAPQRQYKRVLDIGCGTGLMGQAIHSQALWLEGCDLSPAMVAQADTKKIYDDLSVEEAVKFLNQQSQKADLILAADVLVYMGNLAALFSAIGNTLSEDGYFAFTVQSHDGSDFRLGDDARYAHSNSYIKECLTDNYLTLVIHDEVSTRQDRGKAVPGALYLVKNLPNERFTLTTKKGNKD